MNEQNAQRFARLMTEAEEYASKLPPGVIYIPSKPGHNTPEANEAYRCASDETNARYRALCKELDSK